MFSFLGLARRFRTANRVTPLRRTAPVTHFRPALETLEGREVPSATSVAPTLAPALAAPAQAPAPQLAGSLLQITNVTVTNLAVTGANTLQATLNITGKLAGQAFTLPNVQVPITLTQTPNPQTGACDILHLSLQIPDLNVLGLHVQLDNCNNGPVTIDVNAIPSTQTGGGVLGDLLCSLDGALGNLTNLTSGQLTSLTTVLNDVLGGVLGGLPGGLLGGGAAAPQQSQSGGGGGHKCDLVNLHLNPINLDLLGLQVTTSPICLDIFAQHGGQGGGLLGNLLCSVDHLLDSHGNTGNAVNQIVGQVLGILNGLNL